MFSLVLTVMPAISDCVRLYPIFPLRQPAVSFIPSNCLILNPCLPFFNCLSKGCRKPFDKSRRNVYMHHRCRQRLVFLGPGRIIEITPDLHYHLLVTIHHGLLYNPVNQKLKVRFLLALRDLVEFSFDLHCN